MRSTLYHPRAGSGRGHHRGGGALKGTASSRVAVPRPVQTSSLKSESGVFDLTTVLVPAASKDKNGTWGRTIEKAEPESSAISNPATADPAIAVRVERDREAMEPAAVSTILDATALSTRSSAAAETGRAPQPSPRKESAASNPANRAAENRTVVTAPPSGRPVAAQPSPPLSPPFLAGPTATTCPVGVVSPALSEELFPPLSMDRQLEKPNPSGAERGAGNSAASVASDPAPEDAAATVVVVTEPAPSVFQTPSPDEAETEEEKERRRRSLALEQQRLILQQVEAARAARAATSQKKAAQQPPHKPVNRIMKRTTAAAPEKARAVDPKSAPATLTPHGRPGATTHRRGPRTMGRLYARLPDGTLVEDTSHPAAGDNYDLDDDSSDDSEIRKEDKSDPKPVATEDGSSSSVPIAMEKKDGTKGATHWKSVQEKPSNKKNWVSHKRRPKKHQVAAVNS